jgi:membrane protease YdiL (CAAX protease family)
LTAITTRPERWQERVIESKVRVVDDLFPQTPPEVVPGLADGAAPVEPVHQDRSIDPAAWTAATAGRPMGPVPPPPLVALLQIFICSGLPTQVLLQLGALALGLIGPDGHLSLGYAAWLLTADAALTVVLILLFLKWSDDQPRLVFFGQGRTTKEVFLGLMLLPISFSIVLVTGLLVQYFAPWLHPAENPLGKLIREPNGVLIMGGISVLAGAVREEMQRAFALHRFTQLGAPVLGLLVFSVGFGLGHNFQGGDAMIMTTMLGLLWGATYLARRSLVAPAVCHAGFNLVQVLAYGLLVSQNAASH